MREGKYVCSIFLPLVGSSPFSLLLSSTCERLRHCRDDEKHRNDKSVDTIDVMCSLRRYEFIPFALLARRRLYEPTIASSRTYMTDETFFRGQMEFDDTRDNRTLLFTYHVLLRFNLSLPFNVKFRYEERSFAKTDINCTVNNRQARDRAKQIAIHLVMNPKRQNARKNSYSFQKNDLPSPFNNARQLAVNYASPSSARLALMTYRRQDSFITTPAR